MTARPTARPTTIRHPEMRKHRIYGAVARAIRERREAEGMTQRALATACGITYSQYASIESGAAICPLHVLYLLTEALDCTADDLMPLVGDDPEAA